MIPYRNKWLTKLASHSDCLTRIFIDRYFNRHVFRWLKSYDFTYARQKKQYIFHFPNAGNDLLKSIVLEYDRKADMWRMDFGLFSVISEEPRLFDLLIHCRGYLMGGDLCQGDIILDIGAYDGWVACVLAGYVGSEGEIISLEPNPDNCNNIYINMAQNNIKQIQVVTKGLSNFCGKVTFAINESGMAFEKQEVKNGKIVEFDVISLAALIETQKIDSNRVKLIKMDIEGGELDCIDDILEFIIGHPTAYAAIASYHIVDGEKTAITLEEKCSHHPEIKYITLWPQHLTTFILHKDNQVIWQQLQLHANMPGQSPN